jgi:CheY-like chemotaxis protein
MATILVVEDNRDNMKLMDYLLSAFGYRPIAAVSGAEGIRLAREKRPDLILMDIQMPQMDGYEATREIRADRAVSGVPIVAVTSFAMVGDVERIMASGFDGYISKPIEPETFVRKVEKFLPEPLRVGQEARAVEG